MVKRQRRDRNLFAIFLLLFLSVSTTGICESAKERLAVADSLFAQKKYTQSFDLYDEIYSSYKMVTPAMLLKMAFVKEGLGDYPNALYYLNLYYLKTYDKKVLKKMENLAEENELQGYNYNDAVFFLNIYQNYQLQIDLLVISILLLLFGYIFYTRKSKGKVSLFPALTFISLLVGLFIVNNFYRENPRGIISASKVYLMEGPSSGSDVVDVVSFGHRVKILGKKDVWVKIAWQDDIAFIKDFNLKKIEL